jgi:hypothetical protein
MRAFPAASGKRPLRTSSGRTAGGAADSRIPRAKQESAGDRSGLSDLVQGERGGGASTPARYFTDTGVVCLAHAGIAASLTATVIPAASLAYGAEHVPRSAAVWGRDLDPMWVLDRAHVR